MPDPVWPYASTVALAPPATRVTIGLSSAKSVSVLTSAPKTRSKSNGRADAAAASAPTPCAAWVTRRRRGMPSLAAATETAAPHACSSVGFIGRTRANTLTFPLRVCTSSSSWRTVSARCSSSSICSSRASTAAMRAASLSSIAASAASFAASNGATFSSAAF